MASPPELRFWRGHDVSENVLRNAEGPVGSRELGPAASLLLVLAYIVAGLFLRRATWMTADRCETLRAFTFKVLFPMYLLRTLWSINFSLALVVVLPISLVFHILWFFLSQQLSTFTPEAKEVQSASGQPHVCLAGWALLLAQGENMAFTYPLLAEGPSPIESLASAMMWDLGANVWLCQGFLWGIATIYSPQVQAGTYRAICEPEIGTSCDLDIETTELEATFPALMSHWKTSWPAETKEVALKAVTNSILLRACVVGICLNLFGVPLPAILDAGLLQIGALCKALLYLLVGLYADFNISVADGRFMAAALAQRFAAQLVLAVLLFHVVPLPSAICRNAIVVTIFSPGPSVLMHILAEVGYGEHLVKLYVTSSLINTVLCLLIQHSLLQYLPG